MSIFMSLHFVVMYTNDRNTYILQENLNDVYLCKSIYIYIQNHMRVTSVLFYPCRLGFE